MSGTTIRLRLLVEPGAARAAIVGPHGGATRDKIVELAGLGSEEIDRRLAAAGGQERP